VHVAEGAALFRPTYRGPSTVGWKSAAPSASRLAAALLIALAGGAAGWILRGAPSPSVQYAQGLAHQAALAHAVYSPEVRHPVEVGADQEEHLVKWLSKRLGAPLHAPQLGKLGYELMGGRLLPGETGPVAQFMYQDAGGQRLTLYVSSGQPNNRDTGFRFAQEGQLGVFYWIDGKLGYALSAGVSKKELAKLAAAVYEQLDKPPG
jgi:anti-sigma factor RsiW